MTSSDNARVIPGTDSVGSIGDEGLLADLLAAHENGWSVETYLQARELGIGEATLVWAVNEQGFDADWYLRARRGGVTNEELAECRSMRLGTHPYLQAREFGVSHDQFCEAHRVLGWTGANGVRLAGRDLRSYIDCLKEGATHGEALDAARAGLNLHNYADGRYYGLDHEAAKGRARSVLYPPADS